MNLAGEEAAQQGMKRPAVLDEERTKRRCIAKPVNEKYLEEYKGKEGIRGASLHAWPETRMTSNSMEVENAEPFELSLAIFAQLAKHKWLTAATPALSTRLDCLLYQAFWQL